MPDPDTIDPADLRAREDGAASDPVPVGEALRQRAEALRNAGVGMARGDRALPLDDAPPAADEPDIRTPAERRIATFDETIWPRFAGARMADLDADTWGRLIAWTRNPAGRNMLIAGDVGAGKTYAAVAACRERVRLEGVRFYTVLRLLDALRPDGVANDHRTLEALLAVGLLFVDDVGAERATEWTAERLALIVDERWLHERPLLVTTNLSLEGGPESPFARHVGARTYSRLVRADADQPAVVIDLRGPDRRKAPRP